MRASPSPRHPPWRPIAAEVPRTARRPGRLPAWLAATLFGLWALACSEREEGVGEAAPRTRATRADVAASLDYAGSTRCAACHPSESARWRNSHHASAERALSPELDGPALAQASDRFEADAAAPGAYRYRAIDPEGRAVLWPVQRVLAHDPLRQYLVEAGDGRLQVTQHAFDPARREWFDVFGSDERLPGDWGHESGRGMSWNSRCAACHDTGVRVGYDPRSDRFDTQLAEFGVGCETCHGPAGAHARARSAGRRASLEERARLRAVAGNAGLDVCLACHSRRSQLDEDFLPGDRYLDHFLPELPDATDGYHADGQVRGENFVGVSFLLSGMHAGGVHCGDCHDPHSGALLRAGDALCLPCHVARPGFQRHDHHPPESAGARCVNCHMPATVYMQRDPRRDHSFPIPSPQLGEQAGVPDACTGCHAERSEAWASERLRTWFGTHETSRTRLARALAAVRRDATATPPLLRDAATSHPQPAWRAVAAGLLGSHAEIANLETARRAAGDANAWVRVAAARALGELEASGLPQARPPLRSLLDDPVRAVRVEAGRALRGEFDPEDPKMSDVSRQIALQLDQPAARAELGSWLLARGRVKEALPQLERAAAWDAGSPELRSALAIAQDRAGNPQASLATLRAAVVRFPDAPALQFDLALVYAELGQPLDALGALERSVELAPDFARAWYNLGLARRDAGDLEGALKALARAEKLDASGPQAAYAGALILRDMGRLGAARRAVMRALAADPDSRAAGALRNALGDPARTP